MRGPWPTTRVSLNADSTPVCASVSGSPGRCKVQSLRPSSASKACTVRSTPSTNTRSPATSGAVATRAADRLAPLDLAGLEGDQLSAQRDDRGEAPVAADAGAQRAADAGAPELAAAVGLDREDAAVARTDREHAACDADRQRKLHVGEALIPRRSGDVLRGQRIERTRLRLLGAARATGDDERTAKPCGQATRCESRALHFDAAPDATVAGAAAAVDAEDIELGLDEAAVVDLRIHLAPCLLVGGLRLFLLALRQQDVAAPIGDQRRELLGARAVELLQRLVVLLRVEQQAGQAQTRDGLVLVLGGVLADPGQGRQCRIGLAFLELRARGEQAALLREGGPREARLHVGEDPDRAIGIAGAGRGLEFVEHRAGFDRLIALPPVPAVPCGKCRQHRNQRPGDEIPVLLPERFELIELFLFFEVEVRGHGGVTSEGEIMRGVPRPTGRRRRGAACAAAHPDRAAACRRLRRAPSSSSPKISACRAPLASARRNCAFTLPQPTSPAACISTETPAARRRSQTRMAIGEADGPGTTA